MCAESRKSVKHPKSNAKFSFQATVENKVCNILEGKTNQDRLDLRSKKVACVCATAHGSSFQCFFLL